MNKEEMDKYVYELMVKNNRDEAVKNLLLKDKEIERLNNIIKEVREYIKMVETLAINDKVNIFSMSLLKEILDKGSD